MLSYLLMRKKALLNKIRVLLRKVGSEGVSRGGAWLRRSPEKRLLSNVTCTYRFVPKSSGKRSYARVSVIHNNKAFIITIIRPE